VIDREATPQPRSKEWATMWDLLTTLMHRQSQFRRRERGQGLLEYGLIIVVLAVAVIVALLAMGPKLGSLFSLSAASLH